MRTAPNRQTPWLGFEMLGLFRVAPEGKVTG